MAEIKCPNCGEVIKLDKSQYDALLNDVSETEIARRISIREKEITQKLEAEFELRSNKTKIADEKMIADLKAEKALLNEKLNSSAKEVELQVSKATEAAHKEIADKDRIIADLKGKVSLAEKDKKIEIDKINEEHKKELAKKDEDIEAWRNFRIGDSTKDLGESLEQYCKDSFNEIRATTYPYCYFEKDNDDSEGSKGDFIFRDYMQGDDKTEIVSIMFEMKNQKDDTEHKHKNEDFFKKLDNDRTKKGCEYAVLVSTLEEDSKLYNKGIVDVSYRYPKMFVVRPQFFLAIIGLIRNLSLNNYKYKHEIQLYKDQHVDVVTFEEKVKAIAEKINGDYEKASEIYNEVDEMCDAMIKKIEGFRDKFRTAQGYIGKAQKQLDNLSIRKLTRGNKTMKAEFEKIDSEDNKD